MASVLHRLRFRLDHHWAPRHMSSYVDDELSPRRAQRLVAHVRECPECRALLHSLRAMLGLLGSARGGGDAAAEADTAAGIAEGVRRTLGHPPADAPPR